MRVHVLGGRRLEAGGEGEGGGSPSLSCLGLWPPSDWHITFYKKHWPFQLTWCLTLGLFFSFFFFFFNVAKEKYSQKHKRSTEARWCPKNNGSVSSEEASMSPAAHRPIRVKAEKDPAASVRRIGPGLPPNDCTASEGLLWHDTQFPGNDRSALCTGHGCC